MSDVQDFKPASLETIHDNKPAPVVTEPVKAEVAATETDKGADTSATPALDKDGKPIVAETTKPEVKTDDPLKVMRKALNATQREIAELRKAAVKPEAQTDPLVDPEKFRTEIMSEAEVLVRRERYADAMDRGREDHGEEAFEEALQAFADAMELDPSLKPLFSEQRRPDKFIWKYVQDAKARQELGDPVAFEQKIRTEERAKILADVDKLVEEKLKTALQARLPSSLADEQTQGGRATTAATDWAGPKPLEQIFDRKK